jgi:site-specific recombinase XerD
MSFLSKKRDVWYFWVYYNKKLHGISLRTKSYREAQQKAKELAKKYPQSTRKKKSQPQQRPTRIRQKAKPVVTGYKLGRILRKWKSWNSHLSKSYVYTMNLLWKQMIKYFGDIPINAITLDMFMGYISYLRKRNQTESYIGIRLRCLKAVFNWAFKNDFCDKEIFRKIQIPKSNSRIEFLSRDEIKKFLDAAAENPLYQAYLEFLLATGCRRGEFYNLKWRDVNHTYIEFNGKTGRRTFPLQPHIQHILDKIRDRQYRHSTWVLCDKYGRHFKGFDTMSRIARRYIDKARLKKSYVCHTLRHTFASHLVMEGIPIYTVSKLLGHTDVKTTERYAHLSPEQIQVKIEYF